MKSGRSISIAPTAAPKARPINMCSITRARSDLPAVVFRMSCIYGLHQMGTEDQGWVAHFLIRAIEGKPIVLYSAMACRFATFCSWKTWWMLFCSHKPTFTRFPDRRSISAAVSATRSACWNCWT